MALATTTDVSNLLGGMSFTTAEATRVGALIGYATGHIEREADRFATLEDESRTETFDAPESAAIWLRHTPVNSVTSVTVDGTALTSAQYKFTAAGRVIRVASGRERSWSTAKVQTVVVVYNGGYETVPSDLTDVAARAAARAFQAGAAFASVPASASGIRQVALQGSDSVTFEKTTSDVSTAVFLTDDEKAVARAYRNMVIA
jgi:hypothetical protein